MRGYTLLELILVLALLSSSAMVISVWPRNADSPDSRAHDETIVRPACWLSVRDMQRAEQERILFAAQQNAYREFSCD
ncbi:prepilin-type N-terminal cleavage/methylation domain-containing protein [Aliidiomarina sanyensis]|uniref:Uncharacterized protein n=1 Tax=Aliidiomarina sanyensis TaxID=1249555 RepID=A0A432WDP3_9GAMM|nr:prepilin-type N-terminal cleavage/methylation domain-containing protein [Aliidiomarina sanyensis]RUO30506.1 hypothetical protein CWE11_09035 [Aliidiomarina sanyensis]